jgi:hypothetical protein
VCLSNWPVPAGTPGPSQPRPVLEGRLKPGLSIEKAQAQLATLAGRLRAAYPKEDKDLAITLVKTRDVVLNPGFTLGLAFLTGLLCGVAPALQASKPDLVTALRDESAGRWRAFRRLGLPTCW